MRRDSPKLLPRRILISSLIARENRIGLPSYRLGFDIGGSFTDLIAIDEQTGDSTVVKCPTTPSDPAEGVAKGLKILFEKLGSAGNDFTLIVHSTTLVTNTVIEAKGAPTALLTTRGFKDVLEIGREKRVTIYDIFEERLPPLVPRPLRIEVEERTLYDGTVEKKIDGKEIARIAHRLAKSGVRSIAISFLHSYSNAANEKSAKRSISKSAPEMEVSVSSEILREWREYERTSTTVINAYTQPRTSTYMHTIEDTLRRQGFAGRLFIMQSSGGLTTVGSASRYPVKIIESGPAAGALAGAYIEKLTGTQNSISFDMGGTTAKCCLITNSEPRVTTDFEVAGQMYIKGSGYPVRVPTVDLLEIGAGGGSIAHIDYRLLKVGPQSAGADPGPACYPKGGHNPTVTDADLILGYLNPDYFLGGEIRLAKEKSKKCIEELICSPLGVDLTRAASGIYDVVNSNMARAMRIVTVERGQDPSLLSLIAFGGAGPVHATRLARQLKIHRVLVPLAAGVTSALGLLVADMKFDFVKTYVTKFDEIDLSRVKEIYSEMKEEADAAMAKIGYPKRYVKSVDIRYSGQAFEIAVPFGDGFDYEPEILRSKFLDLYKERYGYFTNDPAECVNWRLLAIGSVPKLNAQKNYGKESSDAKGAIKGHRPAYFQEAEGYIECNVYDRYALFNGATFDGPAIVEEKESTCVVLPNQKVMVDAYSNLIIEG
jgi:N-methylhydantoinase A